MTHDSCLLVRTPAPHNDESLLGYVLRISEENGYQSPVEIAQLAGMSVQHVNSRHLPVRKLAPIVGLDSQDLDRYSYLSDPVDPASRFKLNHHDLGPRARMHHLGRGVRICPLCIKEGGFIDAFWDLAISIACPRHSIKALFKCHACNSKIEWARPGLLSCKCGADYLEAPLEGASIETVELMQIIYAKTHDQSILGLRQVSQFPLENFEDIALGQFLHMLRTFAFLSIGYQKAELLGEYEYVTNIVVCFNSIFSNWPNGFIGYLQGDNKLTYSNKPSQNFWKKFRGLYRALSQGFWFDRKCNFIFDELVVFGLKKMRGSLYDLIKVEPKNKDLSHIPLVKRLNFKELTHENFLKLVQLKQIRTNVTAARDLGLPQKVLFALDDLGVFNEFGVPGCYKSPSHPWNKKELDNILSKLQNILEAGKLRKRESKNTIHLSRLLGRNVLDLGVKVSIVMDILDQKITVHDMVGSNFGGPILDEDVVKKYIFHRCPKNYRDSVPLCDVSIELSIPGLLIDSLIHLGFLTAIKHDSEVRVRISAIVTACFRFSVTVKALVFEGSVIVV
ncbi:TniQ family protein [Polynucleobacter sphagniphilus]|uniref:TniQ family protein n=1 Tax=Polynucleobacter sphagniphilus TaxID=1743169 RepID=UPI0024757968|nr:TniQ family protein [Polynucleobacter sphagniphilus]MDH6513682.1 hypothetical protein [Polynucleobacter sphagniphilus]